LDFDPARLIMQGGDNPEMKVHRDAKHIRCRVLLEESAHSGAIAGVDKLGEFTGSAGESTVTGVVVSSIRNLRRGYARLMSASGKS
jgi:hypothetical protein